MKHDSLLSNQDKSNLEKMGKFVTMLIPRLPSLFKTPPHRTFEFNTRYYDADKEERDSRNAQIKANVEGRPNNEGIGDRVRQSFRRQVSARRNTSSAQSRVRLISILAILVLITYLLLR